MKAAMIKQQNVSVMEFAKVGDVVFCDDLYVHFKIASIRKDKDAWRVRFQGMRDVVLYSDNGTCISMPSPVWDIKLLERTEMAALANRRIYGQSTRNVPKV
ncbi:MAG: hypothetical protein Q8K57_13375 [Thiobacillus sp.]|nr:hypothetical protein [Thiobacillus sp.]MDP1925759.1 hypothetical protein [Thiobacillus sp.]